jgi:hypothetical protein
MPGSEASEREFHDRLTAILRATPSLMRVLSVARHFCLPDWLVFSGAVYQPVFNHLTGRPLDYGKRITTSPISMRRTSPMGPRMQ